MRRVIYRLWHNKSKAGKIGYIGKDSDYPRRLNLTRRLKEVNCPKLYRALKKYPLSAWHKDVLISGFRSDIALSKAEKFYIKKFDSKNKGYNCTDGGDGRAGSSPSAETRKKLSDLNKGKWVGKKNGFYGRRHSLETKRHWSEIRKGRKSSPECVAKVVAALTGRPVSLETRRKISIAQKGREFSEEHYKNLVLAKAAQAWKPVSSKALIAFYLNGHTLRQIGLEFGTGHHTIKKFLLKNGVKLRLNWKRHAG